MTVTVVSLSVRFQEIVDHQPAGRALLAPSQNANPREVYGLLEPGNALPLQTEVFEAWPRRDLHRFVCTLGIHPSADKRRVFITFWGMAGQSHERRSSFFAFRDCPGECHPDRRFHRLLKKSQEQIPRGLKPARDERNKPLIGTTEVVPCYRARAGMKHAREPCRPRGTLHHFPPYPGLRLRLRPGL